MAARIKLPARSKYRAKPQIVDNIRFASKREAARYGELKLMAQAGVIQGLTLQPEFELKVNDWLIGKYRADFAYYQNGQYVVEDTKGMCLPIYSLKKKLMKAIHGIDVKET